jgi:hypothetical protein
MAMRSLMNSPSWLRGVSLEVSSAATDTRAGLAQPLSAQQAMQSNPGPIRESSPRSGDGGLEVVVDTLPRRRGSARGGVRGWRFCHTPRTEEKRNGRCWSVSGVEGRCRPHGPADPGSPAHRSDHVRRQGSGYRLPPIEPLRPPAGAPNAHAALRRRADPGGGCHGSCAIPRERAELARLATAAEWDDRHEDAL